MGGWNNSRTALGAFGSVLLFGKLGPRGHGQQGGQMDPAEYRVHEEQERFQLEKERAKRQKWERKHGYSLDPSGVYTDAPVVTVQVTEDWSNFQNGQQNGQMNQQAVYRERGAGNKQQGGGNRQNNGQNNGQDDFYDPNARSNGGLRRNQNNNGQDLTLGGNNDPIDSRINAENSKRNTYDFNTIKTDQDNNLMPKTIPGQKALDALNALSDRTGLEFKFQEGNEAATKKALRANAPKLAEWFNADGTVKEGFKLDVKQLLGDQFSYDIVHKQIYSNVPANELTKESILTIQRNVPAIREAVKGDEKEAGTKLKAINGADTDPSVTSVLSALNASIAKTHYQFKEGKDHVLRIDLKGGDSPIKDKLHKRGDARHLDEMFYNPKEAQLLQEILGKDKGGQIQYDPDHGEIFLMVKPEKITKNSIVDFQRNVSALQKALDGDVDGAKDEMKKIHAADKLAPDAPKPLGVDEINDKLKDSGLIFKTNADGNVVADAGKLTEAQITELLGEKFTYDAKAKQIQLNTDLYPADLDAVTANIAKIKAGYDGASTQPPAVNDQAVNNNKVETPEGLTAQAAFDKLDKDTRTMVMQIITQDLADHKLIKHGVGHEGIDHKKGKHTIASETDFVNLLKKDGITVANEKELFAQALTKFQEVEGLKGGKFDETTIQQLLKVQDNIKGNHHELTAENLKAVNVDMAGGPGTTPKNKDGVGNGKNFG